MMSEKNGKKDFKFDKRAESYDEGFEGRSSRKFYDLIGDVANEILLPQPIRRKIYLQRFRA